MSNGSPNFIQADRIFGVIVSNGLFKEVYDYIHTEPGKQLIVEGYRFVTLDFVPDDRWQSYRREWDRKYMLSLGEAKLKRLGYNPADFA